MSKRVMSWYEVQDFLERIKPLEGSIMRKICESHQEIRDQRDALLFNLKLCRNHLESLQSGNKPAQAIEDVIKAANEAIKKEAGELPDPDYNLWD